MRVLINIFIALFVITTIAVFGFYIFVQLNGKPIVEYKLSKALDKKVEISDARFIFPLGLRVDDLWIEDLLKAKELRVQLGFPIVLGKNYIISNAVAYEPEVILTREKGSKMKTVGPSHNDKRSGQSASVAKEGSGNKSLAEESEEAFGIVIDHLEIKKGKIKFLDTSGEKPIDLTIKDINLKAQTFAYPIESVNTKYHFKAAIVNKNKSFSGSTVESAGSINFHKKDLDGALKIVEPNGMVGLKADLNSKDNDLTVKGKLNINSIITAEERPQKEDKQFSFEDMILGALQSTGIEINVDFAIKTKLDNIQLSSISFSGKVGYNMPKSKDKSKTIPGDLKNIGKQFYETQIKPVTEKEEPIESEN